MMNVMQRKGIETQVLKSVVSRKWDYGVKIARSGKSLEVCMTLYILLACLIYWMKRSRLGPAKQDV
jgi:hypothetical protein